MFEEADTHTSRESLEAPDRDIRAGKNNSFTGGRALAIEAPPAKEKMNDKLIYRPGKSKIASLQLLIENVPRES